MPVRIFLLLLFCLPAYADLLTKADLTYRPEYQGGEQKTTISFLDAANAAIKSSSELTLIKQQRDDAALNLSKAVNSLLPEIKASASKNTLDKSRPDYIEKAAVTNYNAKIKLKQILFSESMLAEAEMAEYRTNAQRLATESIRLDVIRETAAVYLSISGAESLYDDASSSVERMKNLKDLLKANKAPSPALAQTDKEIKNLENLRKKHKSDLLANIKKLSGMTGYKISSSCHFENPSDMPSYGIIKRIIAVFKSVKQDSSYAEIEEFLTVKAIEDSQELKVLDELINLSRRDVTAEKRRMNLPDVSFSGEYTQYIEKGQKETEYTPDFNKSDWNLNFKLSMPVFDGKKTSPDLYEKHSALMDSFHRRAQLKEAVKARMQSAVAQTRYAAGIHAKAVQKKTDAMKKLDEYLRLYPVKKVSANSLTAAGINAAKASEDEIKAYYRLNTELAGLQRAYGKFFAYNGDHDDERFILELEDSVFRNRQSAQ